MTLENDILHLLFSILFLLFLFERGYFQSKAMKSSGELRKYRKRKLSMVLLILFFVIAQIWVIGSFIFILNPQFLEWTRFPLPSWTRWLGAIFNTNPFGEKLLNSLTYSRETITNNYGAISVH